MSKRKKWEFVVFSDLHAHPFTYGAKAESYEVFTPTLNHFTRVYNSRLLDSVRSLDQVLSYAKQKNIKNVLFGGDLFHKRNSINVDTYNLVYSTLAQESKALNIIGIPGNHDFADREGNVHSLSPMSSILRVEDTEKNSLFSESLGLNLGFLPYNDSLDITKQNLKRLQSLRTKENVPTVILGHVGVRGALLGSDYVLESESDLSKEDLMDTQVDLVLLGHYHEHQRLNQNSYYIGATLEHNWGDSGGKRGFLHVQIIEDGKAFRVEMERIETNAPKFRRIRLGEENTVKPGDFVQLIVDEEAKLSQDFQENFTVENEIGHLEVVKKPSVKKETQELSFDHEDLLNPYKAIELWAISQEPDNPEELIAVGKKFMNEVMEG